MDPVTLAITCGLIIMGGAFYIFNPYMAFKPKNCVEQWTTRERSYGHPYYWKLRYCPDEYVRHPDTYNRHMKYRYNNKNIMYLE